MYTDKNDSQLQEELGHEDYRNRLWAASHILKADIKQLRKEAISSLFQIFDTKSDWLLREDIADILGETCPDDEQVIYGLVKRIETSEEAASGGIESIIQSSKGVSQLLALLNHSEPQIRKNTLRFLLYAGEFVIKNFLTMDEMAEFEKQLAHQEAKEFMEHWHNFYPR